MRFINQIKHSFICQKRRTTTKNEDEQWQRERGDREPYYGSRLEERKGKKNLHEEIEGMNDQARRNRSREIDDDAKEDKDKNGWGR